MIKIKLPSPDELGAEDWFEQMELTLYHIKKAYEKFLKSIPEEDQKNVSIYLAHPEMNRNKKFSELLEKEEISYKDSQEIEVVISY